VTRIPTRQGLVCASPLRADRRSAAADEHHRSPAIAVPLESASTRGRVARQVAAGARPTAIAAELGKTRLDRPPTAAELKPMLAGRDIAHLRLTD